MKTYKYNTFYIVVLLLAFIFSFSSCDKNDDDVTGGGVKSVSVKKMPKLAYVIGETLDLSDFVLTLEEGDAEVDIPFSEFAENGIVVEPKNGTVLGLDNKFIVVKHELSGLGITQGISVGNYVAKIEIKTPPQKSYLKGDNLNLSSLVLLLTLQDGTAEELAFNDFGNKVECVPANGDILSLENDSLSITFLSTWVSTKCELQVKDFAPVSGIVVDSPLNEYNIGDPLNLEGLSVTFEMEDGLQKNVSYEDFESYGITTIPANGDKLGSSDTQVKIMHIGTGLNVMLPISINSYSVTDMSVKTRPEKTLFSDGEIMDFAGLVLTITTAEKGDIDISSADFGLYGIITTPSDGDVFVDGTSEIVISYPDYEKTISTPIGSEILYESDFANDIGFVNGSMGNWRINGYNGGELSAYLKGDELYCDSIVLGPNSYNEQLYYKPLVLEEGSKYKYTVTLRAISGGEGKSLDFSIGDGDGSYHYGDYDGGFNPVLLESSSEYITVERVFTMNQPSTNGARLNFAVGNDTKGIVIKYVKVEKFR